MDTIELKLLLKLLGCPNYTASLSKLNPTSKTADRDKACRLLRDRGYIECSTEITKIQITSAGQALLKQDTSNLPISNREINVLKKCKEKKIPPSETGIKDKGDRQAVIQALADRGLVATDTKIVEVMLTESGKEFLRDEYAPNGKATVSLSLLNNYLQFIRQFIGKHRVEDKSHININVSAKPTDLEVLQAIQDLDRQLGTNNYLPIFHLREKLQLELSREELDRVLYSLEASDRIELSSLAEPRNYTPQQIEAGIDQIGGGALFFITITNSF